MKIYNIFTVDCENVKDFITNRLSEESANKFIESQKKLTFRLKRVNLVVDKYIGDAIDRKIVELGYDSVMDMFDKEIEKGKLNEIDDILDQYNEELYNSLEKYPIISKYLLRNLGEGEYPWYYSNLVYNVNRFEVVERDVEE